MTERAVVVLSGGQDSTTSLYWAKRFFPEVSAVSFYYKQRHEAELDAAKNVAALAAVPHKIIPVTGMTPSALAPDVGGDRSAVSPTHGYLGLPSTFTPGRNAIFLVLAAMEAYQAGAHHLVTGVCQTDFSGYPDCRRSFVDALQHALQLGMEWPLQIHTPVMYLTKAQTVEMAAQLDGCWQALGYTITCYHGMRPGCGECPACVIRAKGFEQAGYRDPSVVPSPVPQPVSLAPQPTSPAAEASNG